MTDQSKHSNQLADHFFRHNYAKMVAVLVRHFGLHQVAIAEDIVQDTLVEAMEKWSIHAIPENPEGWLMDVAKKKTINLLRRKQLFQSKVIHRFQESFNHEEGLVADSTLRMIFTCCHPSLPNESQIALALKTLCGLSIPEVARALLTTEENINKRLYRAKKKFRDKAIDFEIPEGPQLAGRLDNVFLSLYLLFNEGYFSLHSPKFIRLDLCYEAIRLLKQVVDFFPDSSKAKALLALMLFSVARFESRLSSIGELLTLKEQDRSLWDMDLIAEATFFLSESIKGKAINSYQIQAGIMAEHCLAKDFSQTNWESIFQQYCLLEQLENNATVKFNKAIAQFYLGEQKAALKALFALQEEATLRLHPAFYIALGMLHQQMNKLKEAKQYFKMALNFSTTDLQKALIKKRMADA